MGARENSLKNATFVCKGLGLGFCAFGLLLFNGEHPYATGLISLGFLLLGSFFLSVARVEPGNKAVKYRRWFGWREVPYSEIVDCGESWVFGYVKFGHSRFAWRTMYFVRAYASDSLFGLDRTVVSTIRAKANL